MPRFNPPKIERHVLSSRKYNPIRDDKKVFNGDHPDRRSNEEWIRMMMEKGVKRIECR